ncbi:MAG: TolC family protein [Candidatus Acidulodesulfobacterium ferriphilum]|uniref:TolC family protein n=1 Tax=Candidatus Acidulodesulfobacterium ferriphilum TaxID=2597223 RepID=A0A519BC17_9DELT|nr:MAG: TolC family protein [Candidatus Acidulodesulfobacterium ferriphilum]
MPNFKSFIKSLIFLFFIPFSLILISNHSSYASSYSAKKSNKTNPDLLTFNAYNNAPETDENIPAAISLKTALEIALKHYPGIMASKYSYVSSIYAKNQSLYLYYPQISGNAGFSKNSVMDVNNSGITTVNGQVYQTGTRGINYSLNNYSGSINATYMLYSFGSRYYNYLSANYNMKGAKAGYSLTINNDLYNVILNFATYFADKELMKADKENLKNSEIQYKAAGAFYRVGTGNLLDAETARATMETARAAYINSIYIVKIARLALLNSIGLPPSKQYHFVNTLKFKPFNLALDKLIKKALKFNPQLKESLYAVKSSESSVRAATSGYFPTFNADFSYTGQNSSFPLNRNYSAGLSVSIPIFNGFLTQNKIEYSRAILNSNIWNRRLTEDNLVYGVSGDYYAILNQYSTVKALKSSADASKLAYQLALKSYEVGVGSMVQLVTANAQYISGITSYINAKFTYFYQKAKLYSDLGLMLEHYIKR